MPHSHMEYKPSPGQQYTVELHYNGSGNLTCVDVVRVARTTVLESGCEYVVPATARLRHVVGGDMMLMPTKGFIERQHVLAARIVIQAQQSSSIPMRIYNPGPAPVTLRKGAVAGILQPAEVLGKVDLQPTKAATTLKSSDRPACPVPSHLQDLYADSCARLTEEDRVGLSHVLQSYSDVFSTGPTDLGVAVQT
ncbi:hypothetical protein L3Q82_025357 [Scortum barcoo]|uniref:Uncharacterized protein n=1 Tax=Scortum barcoo TaxID=214431 RepID=A0ACB8WP76_9TELE|nr:hypothetical protein L3Q82_025357 [Scortum barcoo]